MYEHFYVQPLFLCSKGNSQTSQEHDKDIICSTICTSVHSLQTILKLQAVFISVHAVTIILHSLVSSVETF